MSTRRTPKKTLRRARGFTLVELLVAMVAGLIVALSIVALSKAATSTFHEETRLASAQMQLRSSLDRLRGDLQRAAFMSTANLLADPQVARVNGGAVTAPAGYTSTTDISLGNLQGIRLFTSGTGDDVPAVLGLSSVNNVLPQAIEMSGNFASVEAFPVRATAGIKDSAQEAGICGGQRIHLGLTTSPSIWRAAGMYGSPGDGGGAPSVTTMTSNLTSVFQPVAGEEFIVRYVDQNGQSQFVSTCATTPVGFANDLSDVWVDIQQNTPIQAPCVFAGSCAAGTMNGVEGGTINPVQIVRWEVVDAVLGGGDGGDATKYDLVRKWLNSKGVVVGSPELVAEYVVDLAFGFTVDTSTNPTGDNAAETVFAIDDVTNNSAWGKKIDGLAMGTSNPGPQLIRSVRVRLATRAPDADRDNALDAGGSYLYRYCIAPTANDAGASCTPGSTGWARARTVVTEVSLPNQSRYWYQ